MSFVAISLGRTTGRHSGRVCTKCVAVGPRAGSKNILARSSETVNKVAVGVVVEQQKSLKRVDAVDTLETVAAVDFVADVRQGQLVLNRNNVVSTGIVIFADYLSDLIVLDIVERVQSDVDLILIAAGSLAAYVVADFTSGLYLWVTHNYGSRDTPMFGTEIERVRQIHAKYHCSCSVNGDGCAHTGNSPPEMVPESDFFSTVGNHCLAAIPILTILAGWEPENLGLQTFCVMFVSVFAILPQLETWSKMDAPPPMVRFLQLAGILSKYRSISVPKYRSCSCVPQGNYCVGSIWNRLLDEVKLFRRLERFLYLSSNGNLMSRAWTALDARNSASAQKPKNVARSTRYS